MGCGSDLSVDNKSLFLCTLPRAHSLSRVGTTGGNIHAISNHSHTASKSSRIECLHTIHLIGCDDDNDDGKLNLLPVPVNHHFQLLAVGKRL